MKKRQLILVNKEERARLREEIVRLKQRVQFFEEKGNYDTCHHQMLRRVQAALRATEMVEVEETILDEGDKDDGE
jgi:hypothetical protein